MYHYPPAKLAPEAYGQVEKCMLEQPPNPMLMSWTGKGNFPRTFHGLIDELTALEKPAPDIYVLTAYSAIPLADALRGYYEELGLDTPYITYINAFSHRNSNRLKLSAMMRKTEVERLEVVLSESSAPCVVDEYKNSGNTVYFAREMISDSGEFETIHTIEGQWYHGAYKDDINLQEMTSSHAAFMYETGRKAAILARAQQNNQT